MFVNKPAALIDRVGGDVPPRLFGQQLHKGPAGGLYRRAPQRQRAGGHDRAAPGVYVGAQVDNGLHVLIAHAQALRRDLRQAGQGLIAHLGAAAVDQHVAVGQQLQRCACRLHRANAAAHIPPAAGHADADGGVLCLHGEKHLPILLFRHVQGFEIGVPLGQGGACAGLVAGAESVDAPDLKYVHVQLAGHLVHGHLNGQLRLGCAVAAHGAGGYVVGVHHAALGVQIRNHIGSGAVGHTLGQHPRGEGLVGAAVGHHEVPQGQKMSAGVRRQRQVVVPGVALGGKAVGVPAVQLQADGAAQLQRGVSDQRRDGVALLAAEGTAQGRLMHDDFGLIQTGVGGRRRPLMEIALGDDVHIQAAQAVGQGGEALRLNIVVLDALAVVDAPHHGVGPLDGIVHIALADHTPHGHVVGRVLMHHGRALPTRVIGVQNRLQDLVGDFQPAGGAVCLFLGFGVYNGDHLANMAHLAAGGDGHVGLQRADHRRGRRFEAVDIADAGKRHAALHVNVDQAGVGVLGKDQLAV